MAKERRSGATPIGVELLLLWQLRAAAIHQPDKRDIQSRRQISGPEDILRLAGQPGPGDDLVVKSDNDGPAAFNPTEPIDDIGRPLGVLFRVVERM